MLLFINILIKKHKYCVTIFHFSEFIYENHLSLVEKQLKDLFRSCHELQLTYLMTLQKHFLFDLTIKEEQETLLEG